jgi:hypothetical protein
MTALNIVRFRVKPGHEKHFIAAHRGRRLGLHGFRGGVLVKTGECSYCIVGEWTSHQRMVDARPKMIEILDTFRDDLEDLGAGLLEAHSSDKVPHLFVDLRSTTERAGFPSPERSEAFAMPTHDRLRP